MAASTALSHAMRKCCSAVTPPYVTLEEKIDVPWLEESLDDVKMICKKIVPLWSTLPLNKLTVKKISGGITNILFQVSPISPYQESPVIVRIFGPMTEKVIDRDSELQAMQALSDGGFGANLIGRFGNGVVQSFINAHTLTPAEMCSEQMVPLIASSLARFHAICVPGSREPQLWPTIRKYLQTARALHFEDAAKQKQYKAIDLDRLQKDVDEAQAAADRTCSPIVFSHNDLLSGNIMYNQTTGRMHFIDFEYSAYGFRGYDIANHFCEYAGFECDYSRYPDNKTQALFFRNYLDSSAPQKATAQELGQLAAEVSAFTLASHLFWGIWAIIQARYSPIDFDYMEYFHLRHTEFCRLKAAFSKNGLTH